MVMKILDLDMDFFLEKAPFFISQDSSKRVDGNEYKVWDREKVVDFLETNLKLSKEHKISGRIVNHHHEALYYWRELIGRGNLCTPFEVVHIDSHADLGLGASSWPFIFEKLLGLNIEERVAVEEYGEHFDEYNIPCISDYLLFVIAFRWISKLTYVCNPSEDGYDYLPYILKDGIEPNDRIQLPYNPDRSPFDLNDDMTKRSYLDSAILEPEVAFEIIHKIEDVTYDGDFDFITFAVSPNYTPESADFIKELIQDYMDPN